MPSVFSHAAVPLAIGIALGTRRVPARLTLLAMACSALPDADVLGFALGIPYGHPLGHRGLTHSIAFAACVGLVGALLARRLGARPAVAAAVLFASTASHGLLDALTNGGRGVGLLLPFSSERYFFPWRPIQVSPIGVSEFFSPWGLRVIRSELLWIWLPALALAAVGLALRRSAARSRAHRAEQ